MQRTLEEAIHLYVDCENLTDFPDDWEDILENAGPIVERAFEKSRFNEEYSLEEIQHNAICSDFLAYASLEAKQEIEKLALSLL